MAYCSHHFQSNGYTEGIFFTGSKERTTVGNFRKIQSSRKKLLPSTFIFIVFDIQEIFNFLLYESIWWFPPQNFNQSITRKSIPSDLQTLSFLKGLIFLV